MKKIAIMQPTYLPWIGYFGMIDYSNTFIFLDSVQFNRRSWQQRNYIASKTDKKLLTISVKKKSSRKNELINNTELDYSTNFLEKHQKSIEHSYSNSKFYKDYYPKIIECYNKKPLILADFNINLIKLISEFLNIKTPFVRSSELNIQGKKDEYLYNICNHLSANTYISAPGSEVYLKESNFFNTAQQITIQYFNYQHPEYSQNQTTFQPYLSILDLLFNEGPNSLNIIKSGIS